MPKKRPAPAVRASARKRAVPKDFHSLERDERSEMQAFMESEFDDLSARDLSGSEGNSGSEYAPSDHENVIEIEDIVGDGGSVHEEEEENLATAGTSRDTRPRVANVMSWFDGTDFIPRNFDFDRMNSGIQSDFPVVDDDAQEIEYFEAFFDDELMRFMCDQTNIYYAYCKEEREAADPTPSTSRGKMRGWKNVIVNELYVFLALLMLMAHVKKHVLREYWIASDNITHTPVFSKYMPRDRFEDILRYLHFADNRIG